MANNSSAVLFGASFLLPADSPRAGLLARAAENSRVQRDRSLRIVPFRSRYVAGGDGEGLRVAWRDAYEWFSDHGLGAEELAKATLDSSDEDARVDLPPECIAQWADRDAGFFLDAFGSDSEDTGADSVVLSSTGQSWNERTEIQAEWQERQRLVEAEIDRLGDSAASIDEVHISLRPRTGQAGFFLEATRLYRLSRSGTRIILLSPH